MNIKWLDFGRKLRRESHRWMRIVLYYHIHMQSEYEYEYVRLVEFRSLAKLNFLYAGKGMSLRRDVFIKTNE